MLHNCAVMRGEHRILSGVVSPTDLIKKHTSAHNLFRVLIITITKSQSDKLHRQKNSRHCMTNSQYLTSLEAAPTRAQIPLNFSTLVFCLCSLLALSLAIVTAWFLHSPVRCIVWVGPNFCARLRMVIAVGKASED